MGALPVRQLHVGIPSLAGGRWVEDRFPTKTNLQRAGDASMRSPWTGALTSVHSEQCNAFAGAGMDFSLACRADARAGWAGQPVSRGPVPCQRIRVWAPSSRPPRRQIGHYARERQNLCRRANAVDAGGAQPPGGGLPPTPWTADAGDDDPPFHHLLWAGAGIGIGAVCAQAWTAYRRWWRQSGGISADALDTCVRDWGWIDCPVG